MTTVGRNASRKLPLPGRLFRLLPFVRPHCRQLALATLALVGSALIGLAFPMIIGFLLDAAFVRGSRELLDRVALGLVALLSVQACLDYAQHYLLSAVGERAIAGIRQDLFARIVIMPPGFFTERQTGELTSRLTVDIGLLQAVLSHEISELCSQVLALVGGIALLTYLQPRLTLTALAIAPALAGAALLFGRRLRHLTTGVQDRVAGATAAAAEAFSQIRTVQSFVQEPEERRRYGELLAASVRVALERAKVRGAFSGVLTFSTFAGIVLLLWQGGLLVLDGRLTAGSLVSFLLYTLTIAASVAWLASIFSAYQEAVGAAERVFEILDMVPAIVDPPVPVELPWPVRGGIAYEEVHFRYGDSPALPWILDGITLQCAPGEIVALVGPSGGGKTTLVSLLPRFWDVGLGRILLDGIDIRSLRLADLRRAVGVVPQEAALFSGTVRENIAYARPGASSEEVESAAHSANAHEFIQRLPKGYDTLVGERGVRLSGGQRQRVAIARAVLKDPAVLILDEATSSLDAESEGLIEDALARLLVGRTTLIIAHRLSTVRRADRLVVVDRGRVVEEGSHAALLALGGLYARLYELQFRDPNMLQEMRVQNTEEQLG
jgi:ATP-binding cassette, subfamily B, bacterial MsbA